MSHRWLARLAPLAAVWAAGCFATRNDVRIVQADVERMRSEVAQRDAARDAVVERLFRELQATSNESRDSLRVLSTQLGRHNADSREELYAIAQQMIQIQAMQGLSQQRIQELRAELETRAREVPPTSVMTAPDTTRAQAVTGRPTDPGPTQLFQAGVDQLRRSSYSTARGAFTELLRLYPTSDLAADAQYHIALSFEAEGQEAVADSVFAVVAKDYPTSPRAPTAMYKRGVALAAAGQTRLARTILTDLIARYPRADEVELARDRLRTIPPAS